MSRVSYARRLIWAKGIFLWRVAGQRNEGMRRCTEYPEPETFMFELQRPLIGSAAPLIASTAHLIGPTAAIF